MEQWWLTFDVHLNSNTIGTFCFPEIMFFISSLQLNNTFRSVYSQLNSKQKAGSTFYRSNNPFDETNLRNSHEVKERCKLSQNRFYCYDLVGKLLKNYCTVRGSLTRVTFGSSPLTPQSNYPNYRWNVRILTGLTIVELHGIKKTPRLSQKI